MSTGKPTWLKPLAEAMRLLLSFGAFAAHPLAHGAEGVEKLEHESLAQLQLLHFHEGECPKCVEGRKAVEEALRQVSRPDGDQVRWNQAEFRSASEARRRYGVEEHGAVVLLRAGGAIGRADGHPSAAEIRELLEAALRKAI